MNDDVCAQVPLLLPSVLCGTSRYRVSITDPGQKKRTIVVMHHVISKNLRSDFAAMHRCVKSRQSQVAFARGSAAESSSMIPRYHKILILCINSMVLFFFVRGSTRFATLSSMFCIHLMRFWALTQTMVTYQNQNLDGDQKKVYFRRSYA